MSIKPESPLRWLNVNVIATALITKALVLIFGATALRTMTAQPLGPDDSFLAIWNRWDAGHYLNIAANGYTVIGDDRFLIVFFPFYPALIATFQLVFRDYLVSAFIVSAVASIVISIVFRELVRLDFNEKTSQRAVLFLFIFPTSYFLHIPYTESVFLSLTIGCFLATRKKMWLAAGALGAAACVTRINGLILIPAIAFEVWEEFRETRRIDKTWLWLLLIPAGFALYLLLNYYVTGDPLMFITYQREHWYRYFRFPWEGIWETAKRINNPKPVDAMMNGVQELLFVGIGLFATIAGWKYLRNSYRVWMAANWLLFVSTSFVLSVPRYTITLFPLFILMSRAARRSWVLKVLFVAWSILFLALFSAQFVRGLWAF
jgi:4-amino-4-deoxy-L-arabinose transferase-like glycosyltransferase